MGRSCEKAVEAVSGWRIFAAIVLAVLMPVGGALLVYRVCLCLAYGPADVALLLKGLMLAFAIALAVIFFVVFCGSFAKCPGSISSQSEKHAERL